MQHVLVYVMPMMHNSLTAPCRRRSAFPIAKQKLLSSSIRMIRAPSLSSLSRSCSTVASLLRLALTHLTFI